jgi:D-xylose transport system substrate-binding protein
MYRSKLFLVFIAFALVAAACSGGATQTAPPTQAPATEAPTTQAPAATEAMQPTATEAPATEQPTQGAATGTVALLLPETKTTRYEAADRPYFTQKFNELCPNCELIYNNANQDAQLQLSQAEAALANGAQVLVLDPVDSASAGVIADRAQQQGVPVIAYDRLILNSQGVSAYISFDNVEVGKLQANSLWDKLQSENIQNPTIVMINGAPTDNNAALFKQGAHSVFDPLVNDGQLTIAKEYDTPDWSPNEAQNEMQQALTAMAPQVPDGVYCANDGTASGAIAAMKAADISPLPPVTGQDAELAAIQRILVGEQYMTVYKAIKPEAETAAQMAYNLLTGQSIDSLTEGNTVNNNAYDVPSVLLKPVAVTKDNVKSTVVADGFHTVDQICTTEYEQACKDAGLIQ